MNGGFSRSFGDIINASEIISANKTAVISLEEAISVLENIAHSSVFVVALGESIVISATLTTTFSGVFIRSFFEGITSGALETNGFTIIRTVTTPNPHNGTDPISFPFEFVTNVGISIGLFILGIVGYFGYGEFDGIGDKNRKKINSFMSNIYYSITDKGEKVTKKIPFKDIGNSKISKQRTTVDNRTWKTGGWPKGKWPEAKWPKAKWPKAKWPEAKWPTGKINQSGMRKSPAKSRKKNIKKKKRRKR